MGPSSLAEVEKLKFCISHTPSQRGVWLGSQSLHLDGFVEIWKADTRRPSSPLTWPFHGWHEQCRRREASSAAGLQYPFPSCLGVKSCGSGSSILNLDSCSGTWFVNLLASVTGKVIALLSRPVLYVSGNYFWRPHLEPTLPATLTIL